MKNKNFFRRINLGIVNLVAATGFSLVAILALTGKKPASITFLVIWFTLVVAANILIMIFKAKERNAVIADLKFYIGEEDTRNTENCIRNFNEPLVFLDKKGFFIWANEPFKKIFDNTPEMKNTINSLYQLYIKNRLEMHEKKISAKVSIGEQQYEMKCIVISETNDVADTYLMVYFTNLTDYFVLKEKYENERVAIGEIKIDTYEDIYFTDGQIIGDKAIAELGSRFDKWISGKHAIVQRLKGDSYIFVIEDKYLKELEEDNFSILKEAKMISVQNTIPVTLSIGISCYNESVESNFDNAEAALGLALARGGDQAIVREKGKDIYYGGSNIDITNKNTIKSRVAAEKLKREIRKSPRVVIMGHRNPDMDALGSALAVYRACRICDVPANIVLTESNKSIDSMYKKILSIPEYRDVFVDKTEMLSRVQANYLLVVVDTYTAKQTECPDLFNLVERVAVIDHHRKGSDFIQNTVMDYSETYASSTSELMTEILQYMDTDIKIPVEEAEALYAGILVDTKNFVFKTGIKTFNAAGFLREMGVDFINVKQYFLPDYETFSAVSKVTSEASIVSQKVAISSINSDVKDGRFVAALASDKLLEISGIGASFILVETPNGINISGRSLGEINVQVILEKLGGGGHLTSAGAFVANKPLEEVKAILIKNIDDYFKI